MMRVLLISAIAFAGLIGCGVDGAPTPPEPKAKTGLTISGTAKVGVSGTL